MKINVNKDVAYHVAAIDVQSVVISNAPAFVFTATYQWLDVADNVLRTAVKTFSISDITTMLSADAAPLLAGITSLFASSSAVSLTLQFLTTPAFVTPGPSSAVISPATTEAVFVASTTQNTNGLIKTVQTPLLDSQVTAAGLSQDQIMTAIAAIAMAATN